MYRVLYRKWRPQKLSDVIGQSHVTATLKNELMSGRIAHAYLFTGSRGTGKTTCAKILAKAINCINPQNSEPCGECEICTGIDNGSVMDIVEIDAASNNGVENIRNLREEASFTPSLSKYRVYIIDEVHMLSIGAFNALLKTLEEPPEHVVFILATTEIHKLPLTILSRCQRFDFHRINPHDISNRLLYISEREGINLEESAALLIARIADGGMRDALSLLDQCIGKSNNIDKDIVNQTAGLAGNDYIFRLAEQIINQDTSKCLELINELYNQSKDMIRLCEELIEYFRNLMIIKTSNVNRDLVLIDDDEYEKLKLQSNSISLEKLIYNIDTLQDVLSTMFKGVNKRIEFEMVIVKLCTPSLDSSMKSLVDRICKLERALSAGSFNNTIVNNDKIEDNTNEKTETKTIEVKTESLNESNVKSNIQEKLDDFNVNSLDNEDKDLKDNNTSSNASINVDSSGLLQNAIKMKNWPEVLDNLKSQSKMMSTAFAGSTAYISGGFVLIDAPNSMAFEMLKKSSQREKMRDAIKEITGKIYKLGPYKRNNTPDLNNTNIDNKDTYDSFYELIESAEKAGVEVIKS